MWPNQHVGTHCKKFCMHMVIGKLMPEFNLTASNLLQEFFFFQTRAAFYLLMVLISLQIS